MKSEEGRRRGKTHRCIASAGAALPAPGKSHCNQKSCTKQPKKLHKAKYSRGKQESGGRKRRKKEEEEKGRRKKDRKKD